MRLLFFGSDPFAVESLERLSGSGHRIIGVISKPDKPAGRGRGVSMNPLAAKARELFLPLEQPASLNQGEFEELAGGGGWDAGVVVGYGNLIPARLLELPERGFVNLHPSLLPRFRGAAPVERAIMEGSNITGVTTIRMNERLDAGDILMHREVPIEPEDTSGTLTARLAHLGARLLVQTLDGIGSGSVQGVPQEEEKATYAPMISKGEGKIDWDDPGEKIDRLVRAFNPKPGAYTFFRGIRIKIWSVRITDVPPEDEPGTLMNMGKEGFLVNTGTSCLQVLTLQPEGRSRMTAGEFSRGQRLQVAERFASEPE